MDLQFDEPEFRAWEPETPEGPESNPPESPSLQVGNGFSSGAPASTRVDGSALEGSSFLSGSARLDSGSVRGMFPRLGSSVQSNSGPNVPPLPFPGDGSGNPQSSLLDMKFSSQVPADIKFASQDLKFASVDSESPESTQLNAESSAADGPRPPKSAPATRGRASKCRGPSAAAKHHATIERDRRNRLNASIDRLRLFFTDSLGPKHLVVERACEHIEELHSYVLQVRRHFQGTQAPCIPVIPDNAESSANGSRKRARNGGKVATL